MSDRIHLVLLSRKHLVSTLAWMNDPEAMRLLHRQHVISPEEHQNWFEQLEQNPTTIYFAIEETVESRHIGNVWLAGIDPFNLKAEVRILLGESLGAGNGTAAIADLVEYAFGALGLHRVYAYVLDFNPRAARAFEKAGFSKEGLLRDDRKSGETFHDAWLLSRIRRS